MHLITNKLVLLKTTTIHRLTIQSVQYLW